MRVHFAWTPSGRRSICRPVRPVRPVRPAVHPDGIPKRAAYYHSPLCIWKIVGCRRRFIWQHPSRPSLPLKRQSKKKRPERSNGETRLSENSIEAEAIPESRYRGGAFAFVAWQLIILILLWHLSLIRCPRWGECPIN